MNSYDSTQSWRWSIRIDQKILADEKDDDQRMNEIVVCFNDHTSGWIQVSSDWRTRERWWWRKGENTSLRSRILSGSYSHLDRNSYTSWPDVETHTRMDDVSEQQNDRLLILERAFIDTSFTSIPLSRFIHSLNCTSSLSLSFPFSLSLLSHDRPLWPPGHTQSMWLPPDRIQGQNITGSTFSLFPSRWE